MSKDGVIGLMMAVFGLLSVFVLIPTQIPPVPAALMAGIVPGVGPKVFPLVGAWGVFGFGVILFVQSIVAQRPSRHSEAHHSSTRSDVIGLSVFFAAIVLYIVLLPVLGNLIATPLAIAGYMILLGERGVVRIIVTAALTTILFWFVFQTLLHTILPAGIFF